MMWVACSMLACLRYEFNKSKKEYFMLANEAKEYREKLAVLLNVRLKKNDQFWIWIPFYQRLMAAARREGLPINITAWSDTDFTASWPGKKLEHLPTFHDAVLRGLWARLEEAGRTSFKITGALHVDG